MGCTCSRNQELNELLVGCLRSKKIKDLEMILGRYNKRIDKIIGDLSLYHYLVMFSVFYSERALFEIIDLFQKYGSKLPKIQIISENGSCLEFLRGPEGQIEDVISKHFDKDDKACLDRYDVSNMNPWDMIKLFKQEIIPNYDYLQNNTSILTNFFDELDKSQVRSFKNLKLRLVRFNSGKNKQALREQKQIEMMTIIKSPTIKPTSVSFNDEHSKSPLSDYFVEQTEICSDVGKNIDGADLIMIE